MPIYRKRKSHLVTNNLKKKLLTETSREEHSDFTTDEEQDLKKELHETEAKEFGLHDRRSTRDHRRTIRTVCRNCPHPVPQYIAIYDNPTLETLLERHGVHAESDWYHEH